MSVEINQIEDVYVLKLEETFDMYSAPAVKENLIKFMGQLEEEPAVKGVLLDFVNVVYVDSSAIGVITYFYNQCVKRSINCIFTSLGSQVRKVFSLTGLRFPICDSVEDGVRKICGIQGV